MIKLYLLYFTIEFQIIRPDPQKTLTLKIETTATMKNCDNKRRATTVAEADAKVQQWYLQKKT